MQIILAIVMGIFIGVVASCIIFRNSTAKQNMASERNKTMINILNQWLILQHSNMKVAHTLSEYGVKKVVVYGMGIMGRHLVRELQNTDIEILYALDRSVTSMFCGIEVRKLKERIEGADVVINTVLVDDAQVTSMIGKYYDGKILALENLIFESYKVNEG